MATLPIINSRDYHFNELITKEEEEIMNNIHITKDGKKMLISQMENNHLLNTIKFYLNKIESAKKYLESKINMNNFKSALYGINNEQVSKKAKESIPIITNKLLPYIFEAALRGVDITELLQNVYERKEKENQFDINFSNTQYIEYNEDDLDEIFD